MAKHKELKLTDHKTKLNEHFEAVKEIYKKKQKDVHLARKIRKDIARQKTLESKTK